jgi:hypothetical protein
MNLGKLIERLHPHRRCDDFCHLDPDLRQDIVPGRVRHRSWRPVFGQADSNASHLLKCQVGEGDIFLFFGLFRRTNGWAFVRDAPELHVIYGWLQVDEVVENPIAWARENRWAIDHPHTYGNWWKGKNVLFLAKQNLEIEHRGIRRKTRIPGAGVFDAFDERLQLSDPASTYASKWRLPRIIAPDHTTRRMISTIGKGRWTSRGPFVYFNPGYIRRWQEAVFMENDAAAKWAVELITSCY